MISVVNVRELMADPAFPALVMEYGEESAMAGMPTPIVQFSKYDAYEKVGALHVLAARYEGETVGFIAMLANPLNAHYGVPLAVVESFFVFKERRGTGAGIFLLAAAEDLAKKLGSPKLLISAPVGSRLQALLPKIGYAVTNVVFGKDLK